MPVLVSRQSTSVLSWTGTAVHFRFWSQIDPLVYPMLARGPFLHRDLGSSPVVCLPRCVLGHVYHGCQNCQFGCQQGEKETCCWRYICQQKSGALGHSKNTVVHIHTQSTICPMIPYRHAEQLISLLFLNSEPQLSAPFYNSGKKMQYGASSSPVFATGPTQIHHHSY